MIVTGEFKFMGVESRKSFKDPSKINYILGLSQGLDTIRLYIDADMFADFSRFDPYSDVIAELEYNPAASSSSYAMRLHDLHVKEV